MIKRTFLQSTKQAFTKTLAAVLAVATIVTASPLHVSANATYQASEVTAQNIFISEAEYVDTMKNVVLPYVDSIKQTGYITGEKDVSLYTKSMY